MANDFSYEIVEHIAVLSTSKTGWTKELNLISWNGRTAKYDIREWSPEHEKMGKGITLTDEEFTKLKELLSKQYFYKLRLARVSLFFYNGTIQNGDEQKIEKLSISRL